MKSNIIKHLVPLELRNTIGAYRGRLRNDKLRKEIIRYYASIPIEDLSYEQREVVDYIKKYPITVFPYDFEKKYKPEDVKVYKDISNGLFYVFQDEKRLYFKRGKSESYIKGLYNSLLVEQDMHSPHRYLTADFNISAGDVAVDVGSAEGNFALSIIDIVDKIYLFEADPEWIDPLNATFAPWKDKVTIINKFVTDRNDLASIILDFLTEQITKIDFIKIDVEGTEASVLKGANKILSQVEPLKIALATYHKQDDEQLFSDLLTKYGFEVRHSNGYMIFMEYDCTPPYFKRGIVRAKRVSI